MLLLVPVAHPAAPSCQPVCRRRHYSRFPPSSVRSPCSKRGHVTCSANDSGPAPGPAPNLSTYEYSDSPTDLLFIQMCRTAYARVAGWDSQLPYSDGYRAMVQVSRALMAPRSPSEQRAAVLQGFPTVPAWFRRLFPYSPSGAALNASITPRFFSWLVGPCAVEEEEVEVVAHWHVPDEQGSSGGDGASGSGRALARSAVKIERCRYLAESGCAAMCVNLCKAPTQYFFTQQLG